MSIFDRYTKKEQQNDDYGRPKPNPTTVANWTAIIRDAVIGVGVLILAAWLWPFYSVPTGSRGVVTQFGKIVGIEDEGLAVLPPWRKLALFNIRSESVDIKQAQGATSDTQPVWTSLTVRYAIQTDKVADVYEKYSHNGDLASYVDTASHEVFKAVTARYTAPELIAKRSQVSTDIVEALGKKLAQYGARVVNIDMTNFSFSASYMAAINEKATQEQLRQAADNKLKTVESEQKQKVAIAEAEASAVKATADGEAYATLKNATAKADAMRVQNAALRENRDVLEVLRIQVEQTKAEKWNGQLPTGIYAGAPIPFLNVSK